ncbi:MAG TPA: hypothetical protein VF266_23780, partial [Thermoanaerobaculia bacterium]
MKRTKRATSAREAVIAFGNQKSESRKQKSEVEDRPMKRTKRAISGAFLLSAFCLLLSSCTHEHGEAKAPGREALSFTHFSDRTELFVEFDALARDAESAFAAHVTRLSDFKPLASGSVTAILSGGGAPEERFTSNAPSVPGIFRPVARPQHAGQHRLVFEIA